MVQTIVHGNTKDGVTTDIAKSHASAPYKQSTILQANKAVLILMLNETATGPG